MMKTVVKSSSSPLRRQDGRVRTDACAKNFAKQDKIVYVELRWDDAKALAEFLTNLLEEKGGIANVALIERTIMAVACSHPAVIDVAKTTSKKR